MFYEVFIPSNDSDGFDVTITVEADNWMTALRSGLERTGEGADAIRNVMCDIKDDNSIHVTDATTRRVFVLKEKGEDGEESAPEPVDEQPVDEQPVDEQPVDEQPADEQTVDEEGFATQKMQSLPSHMPKPERESGGHRPPPRGAAPPPATGEFERTPTAKSHQPGASSEADMLSRPTSKLKPPPASARPPSSGPPSSGPPNSKPPTSGPPKSGPPAKKPPAATKPPASGTAATEPPKDATPAGPSAPATEPPQPSQTTPSETSPPAPEAAAPAEPAPEDTAPAEPPAQAEAAEPATPPEPEPEPEPEFEQPPMQDGGLSEHSWTSEDGRMRIGSSTFEALQRDEPQPKVVKETRAPSGTRKAIEIGREDEGVSQNVLEEVFLEIQQIHEQGMSMERVINFVMDLSMEKINAEAGSVMFADVNGRELYFATARGPKAHDVMDFRVPMTKGIGGFCARQGVSLAISDAEKDPRFYKEISEALGYETKNLCCAPVQFEGRVYGVIELLNKDQPFTNTEVNVLTYIGRQLAKFVHDLIMAREKLE